MPSYKKGLLLSLGPINTTVDLYTVSPDSKREDFKRFCPEHRTFLKNRVWCEQGEHEFSWNTWELAGKD